MQFHSFIIFILFNVIELLAGAPTDSTNPESDPNNSPHSVAVNHNSDSSNTNDRKKLDYYEYRHDVAEGVQKALDECREKFKWDRWNCPKKAFLDILDRNFLPSNKEFSYTRALIAASVVLSLTRSCSYGTNNICGCSHTTAIAARTASNPGSLEHPVNNSPILSSLAHAHSLNKNFSSEQSPHATFVEQGQLYHVTGDHIADLSSNVAKFVWKGCDEMVKFGFKVSKKYLEFEDVHDEVSRRINAHNYEVGRIAVKRSMKKKCKCHGISGSCQVNTCWTSVPDMSQVGDYLKRQYRLAAKVGAISAEDSNIVSLNKEISSISADKLVFADASPDYCYENPKLGINGTLGRYCSRAKHHPDGSEVSRSERDSCDRLCTKCGYKIKRDRVIKEKQCDCRFVYCCSVECKLCTHLEDTYRCVRHS